MNNFIFENATKTFFGKACVREYLACLCGHYGKKVMFAYGGGSIRKNGIYDEVLEALQKAGKEIFEFPDIMENPTYTKVLEGARFARENGIEFILGVGGGSVMDCCKAVSMAAVYRGDLWEDFFARPGIFEFEPLPLGVVVTAAGSGSEMNGTAVVTNEAQKVKTGRDYPKCNPRFALMDPVYTMSVPKEQMVMGSFDTISYIMETYFSRAEGENVSDDIAESLLRSAVRDLRTAVQNPQDYNARSNLMWDASMAKNGMIRLGKCPGFACRRLAQQLGAYTGCRQGAAMAVLMPAYCKHIYRGEPAKFARFAKEIFGIRREGRTQGEQALAGLAALADFIREAGLPGNLRELGLKDETKLEEIADSCAAMPGGCRELDGKQTLEIFRESF